MAARKYRVTYLRYVFPAVQCVLPSGDHSIRHHACHPPFQAPYFTSSNAPLLGGSFFPFGRFRQGTYFSQFLNHFLGRNARTRIVHCGLKRAAEQFAPEVGMRLQLPVLAKDDKDGVAWIVKYPFFNEPEQPAGQRRRKIRIEAQSTLLGLRPKRFGLRRTLCLLPSIGPFVVNRFGFAHIGTAITD
jgi:hypothetical protein